MGSLRGRLTIMLALGLGLLLLGAGVWMNAVLSSRLLHEFDQVLLAKAKTLMTLTETQGETTEFDFSDDIMPEFSRAEEPEYFSLWLASGVQVEKSRSLGSHNLPRQTVLHSVPLFDDVVLPNGLSGRFIQVTFVPQLDDDEDDTKEEGRHGEAQRDEKDSEVEPTVASESEPDEAVLEPTTFPEHAAVIVVARERTQLDDLLFTLHLALAGGILVLLVAMIVLVHVALRFGLRPLDDVQRQVTQLDVDSLATGVQVETQTQELAPVVSQLNAMLRRLEAAFARERQFSSDVAHELRTPLAELRTLAEVGGRWPDDREAVTQYFADTQAICEQMEGVVVSLLTLASCDRGVQPIQETAFNLLEAVESSWLTVTRLAQEKSQVFECHIPSPLRVSSDRDMLLMVLSNLLGNAVLHSEPKSTIQCKASSDGPRSQLTISNPTENLSPEDLPHMFDRFWRKDASRSNGSHSGLGLAIVKAFSDVLDLDVQARMDRDQVISITLSL